MNKKGISKELIKTHIEEKESQGYTERKYDTFFDGRVFQICFYSTGCVHSKNGSCIMCDYGKSRKENLTKKETEEIINEILSDLKISPNVLLLNSLGSVLDTQEMPVENMEVLLEKISKTSISVIIFETHYSSINEKILNLIKEKLSDKEIIIELGLESSNKEIRERCLNKYISNEKFIEKIKLIKSFGFGVETNVIFGTPFLNTNEQIKDTINSINWSFENGADEVNLFPINIKPYTLLYKLYERGEYAPVLHKEFVKMLKEIKKEYIGRIYLCWYGNREMAYEKNKAVLPACNENEYSRYMEFYKEFNRNIGNVEQRLKLLNDFKLICM